MSLDGFHRAFAALMRDPGLTLATRRDGIGWADSLDLTDDERRRLVAMAADPRMEVVCSLYRSNRLTALVGAMPALVEALGPRLGPVASAFWVEHDRTDLQFRTEGEAFCRFVAARYPHDGALQAAVAAALADVRAGYDGDRDGGCGDPDNSARRESRVSASAGDLSGR